MKGDRDVTEQSTVERLPIESSLRSKRTKVCCLISNSSRNNELTKVTREEVKEVRF